MLESKLLHTCSKCRRVFVWCVIGSWKDPVCKHCKTAMTKEEQERHMQIAQSRYGGAANGNQ